MEWFRDQSVSECGRDRLHFINKGEQLKEICDLHERKRDIIKLIRSESQKYTIARERKSKTHSLTLRRF